MPVRSDAIALLFAAAVLACTVYGGVGVCSGWHNKEAYHECAKVPGRGTENHVRGETFDAWSVIEITEAGWVAVELSVTASDGVGVNSVKYVIEFGHQRFLETGSSNQMGYM